MSFDNLYPRLFIDNITSNNYNRNMNYNYDNSVTSYLISIINELNDINRRLTRIENHIYHTNTAHFNTNDYYNL